MGPDGDPGYTAAQSRAGGTLVAQEPPHPANWPPRPPTSEGRLACPAAAETLPREARVAQVARSTAPSTKLRPGPHPIESGQLPTEGRRSRAHVSPGIGTSVRLAPRQDGRPPMHVRDGDLARFAPLAPAHLQVLLQKTRSVRCGVRIANPHPAH